MIWNFLIKSDQSGLYPQIWARWNSWENTLLSNSPKYDHKQIILFQSMKVLSATIHFKQYNWAYKGKDSELQSQKFVRSIKIIAAIFSNGTYFVRLSNMNTKADIFEEFLWDLEKFINSKNYFSGWRFSIILDNASYHKTNKIRDKLISMNNNVWYLPPYTPQFQPVEVFFGIIKGKLREAKLKCAVRLDLKEGEDLIHRLIRSISPAFIIKWFRKAIVSIRQTI